MLNQKIKAMINNRQIALAIQRGRRFLTALKAATDSGTVTKEQFQAIAKEHQVDKNIPESYVVSGILAAYEIPQGEVQPNEVIMMERKTPYLVYWKQEPNDAMAYSVILLTDVTKKSEAFERFMLACNLPPSTNCLHCGTSFTSRLGKKFCSDKCRWIHNAERKHRQNPSLKEWAVNVANKLRDFFKSL